MSTIQGCPLRGWLCCVFLCINFLYFLLFVDDRWDELVVKLSNRWRDHVQRFLTSTETSTLVVKYENLLSDLHTELERMMKFLEFPYTEDDLQCTIKSAVEGFHRKHNKNVPYTPEQRKLVSAQIKLANEVLHHYSIQY